MVGCSKTKVSRFRRKIPNYIGPRRNQRRSAGSDSEENEFARGEIRDFLENRGLDAEEAR